MKKMLMLASVASMIDQFNMPNIQLLQEMGYEVHVACNFEEGNTCSKEKILDLKRRLKNMQIKYYQIDFSRSVSNLEKNLKAYRQLYLFMKREKYEFVHCHSPIGGVIGRLVGHRTRTKVIYTAHGFHFFKGAPIKNWILYYPVERFLARYTDVLITINKEDYHRAKNFKAKNVEYIPGVGVDIENFRGCKVDVEKKRKELGIPKDAKVLLSVGELNKNKNHQVIIKALSKINDKNCYYLICGQGILKNELEKLAKILGISEQVKLLGFRLDMRDIYKTSDIFVFPSRREGLGLVAIEGMASGLPILTSNIHGIKDYSKSDISGYNYSADDVDGFVDGILKLLNNSELRKRMGENNQNEAMRYDIHIVRNIMERIYICI